MTRAIPPRLQEPKHYEFEKACVLFRQQDHTHTIPDRLFVQAWDAYSCYYELIIFASYANDAAKQTGDIDGWWFRGLSDYTQLSLQRVSRSVGNRLIAQFLYLCEEYPELLFNQTGQHTTDKTRPCNCGFVKFANTVLAHPVKLSVDLLTDP